MINCKKWTFVKFFILILNLGLLSGDLRAQGSMEEQFQDVFVLAGYSAILGGAFAAATLPFFNDYPIPPLRLISGGASLGFILGTAFALSQMMPPQGLLEQKGVSLSLNIPSFKLDEMGPSIVLYHWNF